VSYSQEIVKNFTGFAQWGKIHCRLKSLGFFYPTPPALKNGIKLTFDKQQKRPVEVFKYEKQLNTEHNKKEIDKIISGIRKLYKMLL